MGRAWIGVSVGAVCAVLLLPGIAAAGVMTIATGPSSAVDGYLSVSPDEYGAWAHTTFGGGGDLFNPLGAFGAQEAAFTSGFFLFSGGSQRELLSDNNLWQGVVGGDASLDRSIVSALVASDSSGNGVDDTLNSAFRVVGGGTDLHFDLVQRVASGPAGVAFLQQDYSVTNNGGSAIDFSMVRAYDGDLEWSGSFDNDEVGTSMHGAGLGTYVFEQEDSDPGITAITLSSLASGDYYGGKHGVDPGGGGLPYDYGTDTEVWDAFGIPGNWANHIAGVGYNLNGESGTAPPGSTSPEDGFIGIDMHFSLLPGESTTFRVFHTYGQNTPIPAPGAVAAMALAGLAGCRRRRRPG